MLCVVVQSFICIHDRMKLSSLNCICLCLCLVSVSYTYIFNSFTNLEIVYLFQVIILPLLMTFMNLISLYLTRHSQPIMCYLYPGSECTGWSDLTELQNEQHDHLLGLMYIFISTLVNRCIEVFARKNPLVK